MNYFVFGTNNMQAAVKFYDRLFESLEMTKIHNEGRMTLWSGTDFMFALAEPFDGKEASIGNGTMVGFNLNSKNEVIHIYDKALSLGGKDEGQPGMRSGHFSAYVRDIDNNKICLFNADLNVEASINE